MAAGAHIQLHLSASRKPAATASPGLPCSPEPAAPCSPLRSILTGTLHTLAGQTLDGAEHHRRYLRAPDGRHWLLDTPPHLGDSVHSIQPGSEVEVQFTRLEGRRLMINRPPRQLLSSTGQLQRRGLQGAAGQGTAPKGNVSMIIFIMDLEPLCGTAKAAVTPQVQGCMVCAQEQLIILHAHTALHPHPPPCPAKPRRRSVPSWAPTTRRTLRGCLMHAPWGPHSWTWEGPSS
jgi:hypothetical protein